MQETYVKDPQDDMYLAMDPPEAKFELQTFALKIHIFKDLHTFSRLFQK